MKLKEVLLENKDKEQIIEYLKKELMYFKNNSHIDTHRYVAGWLKTAIKHIQKM